jgi:hypothetical protein
VGDDGGWDCSGVRIEVKGHTMKKVLVTLVVLVSAVVGWNWPVRASGITQQAYNLVENSGSALTMRSTLNFTGSGVSCVDNSGSARTDCTVTGGSGSSTLTIANAASTGTTANTLTKLTGAPSTAVITATTDSGGAIGITTAGAGTSGSATVTISGSVSCVFDGATTAGHYVQISTMTTGNCHDAGGTYPTAGQILGRVLGTNASGGTYTIDLFPSEIQGASGGGGGGYTTVQNLGSSLTARTTLNFANGLGCADVSAVTTCTGFLGGLPPTVAASTWVNQASATTTTVNGLIAMTDTANDGTAFHVLCQAAPSTPYTITMQLRYGLYETNTFFPGVELGFTNGTNASTSKGEFMTIWDNAFSGTGFLGQWQSVAQWNSSASFSGELTTRTESEGTIVALQISDDGTTNKTWQYSFDGITFITAGTEPRTTFLTATDVCWGLHTQGSVGLVTVTNAGWQQH